MNLLSREIFDAPVLLKQYPPQFSHAHKIALFEIAYPTGQPTPAAIEVTRWSQSVPDQIILPSILAAEIRPDFYDYQPVTQGPPGVEWHVNFADPDLFVAYGSRLFAQDEMQVAEHPLLASVREALLARGLSVDTTDQNGGTPILLRNVERRIAVATNADASAGRPAGLYGNRFAAAPLDVVRRATQFLDPATFSNIIAMAAPACGAGNYSEEDIEYIFTTAHTAFAAAAQESMRGSEPPPQTIIHTGFWGCGAFGGNRRLMVALQALAARAARIDRLILHAGDEAGVEDALRGLEVAESVTHRCGSPCSLDTLVGRCAILGYRWGQSDGN